MADEFETHAPSLTSPVSAGAAITPSDTVDLPQATRVLYVGIPGDVRVQLVGGDEVTLIAAQGGAMYPIRAARVLATGTTAGALVGLR